MSNPKMPEPIIQGWCPGALRPMQSGDGLVVRVRTHLGRIMPDEARALADLSRRFGNGLMDVTNRANLQLRGVTPETHPPLIDALREMGLIDRDAEAEARRNVMLSPLAEVGGEEWQTAEEISRLMTQPDAPKVPGKFGFAVQTIAGELNGCNADIWVTGGPLAQVTVCDQALVGVADDPHPQGTARLAVDLARWFVESGGVTDGRGRMADHIKRGAVPPMLNGLRRNALQAPPPTVGEKDGNFFIGLPFGQLTPDILTALAGFGPLRLTPWRMLMIEGLSNAPSIFGIITDPDDPLMRVNACTGAPGCPQALADVRALARTLAPRLGQLETLHVSGCAKGCAHRGVADVTLIATDAQHFNLIRKGTVQAPVTRHGLTVREIPL